MTEKMFDVEMTRQFDVVNKSWENKIFLRLYLSFFRSGLVAELGTDRAMTLLAIASFMNEKGECYPTQEQIGDVLGVNRKTAFKYIKNLLEFRWNGHPLIIRDKKRVPGSPYEVSVYTILPLAQIGIFNSEVESVPMSKNGDTMSKNGDNPMCKFRDVLSPTLPTNHNQYNNNQLNNNNIIPTEQAELDVEFKNAKEVLTYFCKKYRETYSVNYTANWGRESAQIKNKLMENYSASQIKQIIDMIFENYDTRWKTKDFPRPTVGQLVTWLPNKALALIEEKLEEEQQFKQAMSVEEHGGRSLDEILARIG
ncbi:helix-turn-helix domain-containing protein [Fredinandcohnia humi]